MKRCVFISLGMIVGLAACTTAVSAPPTPPPSATHIMPTPTPRVRMLPTWTPIPSPSPRPSLTPRPTNTPWATATEVGYSVPGSSGRALLIDRPSFAILAKPADLVSLHYDPGKWSLTTTYPTGYMGYALTHRFIYDCKLDPTVGSSSEGLQVEQYTRPLGGTTFRIARVSQAAVLEYANYCAGEGEAATCYQVTPGDDHEACISAAEEILSTYELVPNPFLDPLVTAPNHWLCQDEAGVDGHCTISYSVPLNALAFTSNGEGWAAGDDGLIYRLSGSTWAEVVSPRTESIYDLSFSSLTNGWAVGVGGVLHWDGNEWSGILPQNTPEEDQGGSTRMLYAVDAASKENAWMVGTMKGLDAKYTPYVLHWDGNELRLVNGLPEESSGLNAVLILGDNDVLAVGGSSLGAMSYRWDGSNWTPTPVTGADMLYALRRASDGTVWAAGIEYARDQSDTRGALFRWDGTTWQKISLPPLTGGIYQLALLPTGQIALGGDFTALWSSTEWQPIIAEMAGYGWIADIETDAQGVTWALTHSGKLLRLEVGE